MLKFRYSGCLFDGTIIEGTIYASNPSDLELRLLNKGIILEKSTLTFSKWQQFIFQRFKQSEITRTTRQISLLLKGQVSVIDSLQLAGEQITDKGLQRIWNMIIAQVEAGKSLANAMADYPFLFDRLYLSMVEAGELSGTLDFTFDTIASYKEKHEQVTRKVKSALAYPALVVVVAILVVFALALYVVPVFSSMYENFGAELPSLTQKVVSINGFLRESIWYWFPILFVLILITSFSLTTKAVRIKIDRFSLKIPLLRTLLIKIITARYCRTMGALITSGVDIISSLQISAQTTGNLYATQVLEPVAYQLAQGKSLTESLESCQLFPKAVLRLCASGEKTGKLGEMLTRSADYYENQTDTEITTIMTLIEPIIIIILGIFIAFILVAMYLPLFELVGTM